MRYHYKPPEIVSTTYGEVYRCNHPVYNKCTLYRIGGKGLAVIQQRYSLTTKRTWWNQIDPWFQNELYLHEGFLDYFKKYAKEPSKGLYPTVTIRQIMWALKIKPIKREPWETSFDHCPI